MVKSAIFKVRLDAKKGFRWRMRVSLEKDRLFRLSLMMKDRQLAHQLMRVA